MFVDEKINEVIFKREETKAEWAIHISNLSRPLIDMIYGTREEIRSECYVLQRYIINKPRQNHEKLEITLKGFRAAKAAHILWNAVFSDEIATRLCLENSSDSAGRQDP